jgi:hypothetical protein
VSSAAYACSFSNVSRETLRPDAASSASITQLHGARLRTTPTVQLG